MDDIVKDCAECYEVAYYAARNAEEGEWVLDDIWKIESMLSTIIVKYGGEDALPHFDDEEE